MSARRLSRLAALSLSLFCAAAQSASISLTPGSQNVALGNGVSLQLTMDFSDDATLGGGIDIFFDDSILQFVSFTFDPGFVDDPDFRRQPDVLAGELDALAFGNFAGLSGPYLVGTFLFDTLTSGTVNFTLAQNDTVAGGFYSANSYDEQIVTFNGAMVTVSAVPLPAAGWLLMGGAGLLASIGRRRLNAS